MEIRPYKSSDFDQIKTWISDKQTHALWCADLMQFPLEKHNFENILKENNDTPLAVLIDGKLAGFFAYLHKEEKLKFIILAPSFRGKGYGKKLVASAVKYAFNNKAKSVQLNVFQNNIKAKNCYLSLGFKERKIAENAFKFNDKFWARCNMVIENNCTE